jgi:hypothetical protein
MAKFMGSIKPTSGAGVIGTALGAELLAELISRTLGGVFGGNEAPPTAQGAKYLISPSEIANLERVYGRENLNRALLRAISGGQLGGPPIDVEERLTQDVNRSRMLAEELGQRERALASIQADQAIIPALASAAASQAGAVSNLGQQFLQSYLARPNIDPALAAMATGK